MKKTNISCVWGLGTQWEQCMGEGRDVAYLKETCDRITELAKTDYETANDAAAALFELMENAPMRADFDFEEPSALEEIKSARPTKRHIFSDEIDEDVLKDKLLGAWTGRVAGCLLGKPIEGWRTPEFYKLLKGTGNYPMTKYICAKDFTQELIDEFHLNVNHCWADKLNGSAPIDDDTNYTTLGLRLLEIHGNDFTPQHVMNAWCDWLPPYTTFTAERIAIRNALMGIAIPETASYMNECREYIGAQIRGDIFGYVNPGRTELAAEMAYRDACISHVKNGIYGEMYIAAMLAAAAKTNCVKTVIEAGLDEIPEKSRLRNDVEKVIAWYNEGKSGEEIIAEIHKCYDEKTFYGWCMTNSNAMIVTMALLCGGGDYGKSICLAVQSAFDTDCNGATVGSIVGMMYGTAGIPEEWCAPFGNDLNTSIIGMNRVHLDDLAQRTLTLVKKFR